MPEFPVIIDIIIIDYEQYDIIIIPSMISYNNISVVSSSVACIVTTETPSGEF